MAATEAAEGSALLLSQYQATTDTDEVDLDLIQALLEFVSGERQHAQQGDAAVAQGAVLVFLPGTLTRFLPSVPVFCAFIAFTLYR